MSPLNNADVDSNDPGDTITTELLIQGLSLPCAYPHATVGGIEMHETHISIVFLAGEFAYKIKKPIKTVFLDYSSLKLRRDHCEKEVQLDSRFAYDLYLGVVPIGWKDGLLMIEADTEVIARNANERQQSRMREGIFNWLIASRSRKNRVFGLPMDLAAVEKRHRAKRSCNVTI